eukprot:7415808-Pyramimonas_sp.AAC.1
MDRRTLTAARPPISSLAIPVIPTTPVLHPPPKLTVADGASLQLGSHRRDEPAARVYKAYLTVTEGTSLQLENQKRCPWMLRAPQGPGP